MSGERERFELEDDRGRIAYEHLHRYAICREYVGGKRVLDLASGTGYGSYILAAEASEVIGVDLSARTVRQASKTYVRPNLKYVIGDCFDLPFDAKSFDVVVANEMIEHVDDHDALIGEARRVLVDGGLLLLSTPNKSVYNQYKSPNPFHVSEMELDEFRSLLSRHFGHVHYTGLRMALVSAGYDLDGGEHGSNLSSATVYHGYLSTKGKTGVENEELALASPEYVLAACSDRPIDAPRVRSSLFYSRESDLWLEHERIMAWASQLHTEDEVLRSDLSQSRSEADRSRDALSVAEREKAELNDRMSEARQAADIAARALEQQHEALTRESTMTLQTTARLVGHMVSAPVEADQISLVEAMFKLNEATVTQRLHLASLEARNAERETQLSQALSETVAQKNRTAELENLLAAARHHAVGLDQQLEELRAQHARVMQESAAHSARSAALDNELSAARHHAGGLDEQLEELRAQHARVIQESADHSARSAELRQQYAKMVADLESKEADARRRLAIARRDADNRDAQLAELRAKLAKANADPNRLRVATLVSGTVEQSLRSTDRARASGTTTAVAAPSPHSSPTAAERQASMENRAEAMMQRRKVQFSTKHRRIQEQLSRANDMVRGRAPAPSAARPRTWVDRLKGNSTPLQTILFDPDWIERQNPDVGSVTIERYLTDRRLFELDPHPLFAARAYLDLYPDVAESGMAPLEHYVRHGWREGRDPHPYFTNDWYLHQNADVLAQGDMSPLEHYLAHGWTEGRRPNPVFDPRAYLDRYPDVMAAGFEPLTHYVIHGAAESREIPFAGDEADWRSLVPASGTRSLIDYLLQCPPEDVPAPAAPAAPDAAAAAAAPAPQASRGLPDDGKTGVSLLWPPAPINDYWLAQQLRDFTVAEHGEDAIPLYRYLCSVMEHYGNDPEAFVASQACRTIVARARRLSLARTTKNERPDASIVVPVYNNIIDTLLCLVSVLESETTASYEIIVADDGSSDATASLVPQIGGIVRHLRQPQNSGFLGNCNAAARSARGRTLVLLNNDTLVMPGWLDGLLEPFEQHDRVGLVGSKLLSWDGSLQEAGGIFWEDGSAWNFGRGADALAPQYNYLKDVDYCSGASIAIPLSLWQHLGGFDKLYEPAYCEDADLAFRIRAAGYRTLYSPRSEVIHHEGRSHGRDLNSGVKAYQVTNQQRFLERWGDVLARDHFPNAQNVLAARDRSSSKPHVLVVDHNVPQWDRDAGSRTIYQYIEVLIELGCSVTFWPENLYRDPQYAPVLQMMGVEVIYGPQYRNAFDTFIRERGHLYDAAFLSRPEVATKFLPALRAHSDARILYYGHDLHFRRMQSSLDLGGDIDLAEIERVRDLEMDVCRDCDVIFYPDPEEVNLIAREVGGDREFIANPVFIYSAEQIESGRTKLARIKDNDALRLLFVGGFNHHPNREGILWFVDEVLPLIRKQLGGVKLDIAGSNPPPEVLGLAAADVAVLGLVSDAHLQRLYAETSLAIAPLRYGAGVKGKVIEALALGVPVATTPIGAQGIEPSNEILFLGETPVDLARAIVQALTDREAATTKARRGLTFIKDHYGRDAMSKLFQRLIVDGRPRGA